MAARRLLLAAAAAFASLCAVAAGQDEKVVLPFAPTCSTSGNYTDGSQYQRNLAELLSRLPAAAGDNGWFYNGTAGAGADRVFGLIMCYADRNATQCRECLTGAPAGIATAVCPGSRNVSAAYDACVLRYADTDFFAVANPREAFYVTRSGTVDRASLDDARSSLMNQLAKTAADAPLLLANESAPLAGSPSPGAVYGLAQCTRDLTAGQCSWCLTTYINQLRDRFPNNTGGAIKGYSCYVRYKVGAFDITLPPRRAALPPPPVSPPTPPSPSVSTGLVVGLSVAGVLLIGLGLSIWLLCRRRRKRVRQTMERELEEGDFLDDEPEMQDDFEKGTGPKRFRYGELAIATDDFSDDHKLGEGGFGSVYRGFLKEMNLDVAIKKVSKSSKQGRKEYASEVSIISRLRHRNLVQLIGWCHGGGEFLLVYELMPNGSLDTHLYSSASGNTVLPWPLRHEIVLGLGSALLYLHQDWEQCVLHRDVKPSNVMLDASFHAKLGDFGLARLVDHGRGSHTTVLAGTLGYMDLGCRVRGRASAQFDVYSFGVVLLEIACGRKPVVPEEDESKVLLVRWVWELYGRGELLDAADARLLDGGEAGALEVERTLVVGLWCVHPDSASRPSIRQAMNVLQFEAPLPELPPETPVATYGPPVPVGGGYQSSNTTSTSGTGSGSSRGHSSTSDQTAHSSASSAMSSARGTRSSGTSNTSGTRGTARESKSGSSGMTEQFQSISSSSMS